MKDTEDNDLDPEQLVLDVFVDEGKANADGLDQIATISVIQDQRQVPRFGSVIPDLTPIHYLPQPRPPIPRFSQVSSTLGKRIREEPGIQETPGQHKRSRLIEIAQTQDDNGLARSIEHSPELVHDSQKPGVPRHEETDQYGDIVKDESPTIRKALRDIEPATGDELEWLSARPQDFISPRGKPSHKRQGLHPKTNGIISSREAHRSRSTSRRSQLPITPPTDPTHISSKARNIQTDSHEQQIPPTSGQRFKKAPRRDLYAFPADSDIEDSQMPKATGTAPRPRLAKTMSTIEEAPARHSTEGSSSFNAAESLQPMEVEYPSLSNDQQKPKAIDNAATEDDSDEDADARFTSARASTSHETTSEAQSGSEEHGEEDEPEQKPDHDIATKTSSEPTSESDEEKSSVGVSAVGIEDATTVTSESEDEDEAEADEDKTKDEVVGKTADSSDGSETEESDDEESNDNANSIHHDAADIKGALSEAESESSTSTPGFETVKSPFSSVARSPPEATSSQPPGRVKNPKGAAAKPPADKQEAAPAKPRKSRAAKKADGLMPAPSMIEKAEDVKMADSSVQTRSAKRGPMSKLVSAARSLELDHDSPGEQLTQDLRESANDISIPETGQETTQDRRPSTSSSPPSTPTRDRIGLGITNSPRRKSSIVVDIPPEKGTDKMISPAKASAARKESTTSVSVPPFSTNVNGPSSFVETPSAKQTKNAKRKGNRKAKKASQASTQQAPSQAERSEEPVALKSKPLVKDVPSKATNKPAADTPQPTATATKGIVLPAGMTMEAYEAFRSTSNITEADREIARKANQQVAARTRTRGKNSKTPIPVVKTNETEHLAVPQLNDVRATSSPADDFAAISMRLSSIGRSSDKGSMPPPVRKGILKKQTSSLSRDSTEPPNGNSEQHVVNAVVSTPQRDSPAVDSNQKSREPSIATLKKASFKAVNKAQTPMTQLQKLRLEMKGRNSGTSTPTSGTAKGKGPEKKGVINNLSKVVQIGGDDSSSDEESDDSSDDDVGKIVASKKGNGMVNGMAGGGVDRSIRDPTPSDDSDDSD